MSLIFETTYLLGRPKFVNVTDTDLQLSLFASSNGYAAIKSAKFPLPVRLLQQAYNRQASWQRINNIANRTQLMQTT